MAYMIIRHNHSILVSIHKYFVQCQFPFGYVISFLEVVWTFWILDVGVSFEEDSNFWCILFANFFPIGGTVEKEFLILVSVVLGHFGKTMRASTSHTNPK